MKMLSVIAVVIMFCSCETKPYIKHELKAEKKGTCDMPAGSIKTTGNINGERFEFLYCLPDNFNAEKDFTITRNGDTLITNLSSIQVGDKAGAAYQLTLDVTAYPKYSYIKIGEQIIHIVPFY